MKMKSVLFVAATMVLAVCATSYAQPGRGPGGRGPGGGIGGAPGGGPGGGVGIGRLQLLQLEAVQKELELLDDQIEAIAKLREELRPQRGSFDRSRGGDDQRGRGERPGRGERGEGERRGRGERGEGERRGQRPDSSQSLGSSDVIFVQVEEEQPQRRGFQGLSDEERQQRIAEFRKQAEERRAQEIEKLGKILLPHQMERLNQIYIQVLGVRAFQDPDVAKQLKITEKQQQELREVQQAESEKVRDRMRELFQSGDRDKIREEFTKVRKDVEEKVLGVLTKDQRKQFDEMKGQPFELPAGAAFGGFGRGPGAGGEGNRPSRPQGGERSRRPGGGPDA